MDYRRSEVKEGKTFEAKRLGFPSLHFRLWYTYRMKGGLKPRGFTIIETLIVLAVTGALLVMGISFINGRQNRTQFTQGVRDMESRLQQTISNVATGYYPNNGNFTCQAVGSNLVFTAGSKAQGTNKDCIFLGKVIQFAVNADDSPTYHVYNLVGLREAVSGGALVSSLSQARPRVVPNVYDVGGLRYGVTVSSNGMKYNTTNSIGAVGFVGRLGAQLGGDDTSQQVDLLAIRGTSLGDSATDAINEIESNVRSLPASAINPSGGVRICLNSNGSTQSALMTIGGAGRQLTVTTDIKNTKDCV